MDRITIIMDVICQNLQRSRGAAKLGSNESPQRILAALVRLLALENPQNFPGGTEQLRQYLHLAVANALRLVSASTMLFTCLQLLRSNDLPLQIELYTLLGNCLSDVNAEARSQMSSDVVLLAKIVKDNLATTQSTELSIAAMKALQAVTRTARPAELSALTETVPIVTNNLQTPQLSDHGIQTLHMLW